MTLAEMRWRKARGSANEGNCVEVSDTLDQVRDSKNPTGPTLDVDVVVLAAAMRAGFGAR